MKTVNVNPHRDHYGKVTYTVAETRGSGPGKEVRLTHPDIPKEGFWLYEAHTNVPREMKIANMRKNINEKIDRATKIGAPKIKPGKK